MYLLYYRTTGKTIIINFWKVIIIKIIVMNIIGKPIIIGKIITNARDWQIQFSIFIFNFNLTIWNSNLRETGSWREPKERTSRLATRLTDNNDHDGADDGDSDDDNSYDGDRYDGDSDDDDNNDNADDDDYDGDFCSDTSNGNGNGNDDDDDDYDDSGDDLNNDDDRANLGTATGSNSQRDAKWS